MKTAQKTVHSYDSLMNEKTWGQSSERKQLETINNLFGKKGRQPFRKSTKQRKAEREAIKAAMYAHPAGKHAPDNRNVVLADAEEVLLKKAA